MPMVHMHDMLSHAHRNGYAVGAFDVVSLDLLQGVIGAAERCRAPLILGVAEPHLAHVDPGLLMPAVEAAACRAAVPVAVHFDHGSGLDSVAQGIGYGCNGVMLDGSHLELRDNIELSKAVVEMAHACGVPVEAELGCVPASGDEPVITTVEEARGFVRLTGVDFLAVSIGTVHGRLSDKARLDYQRLRQLNEALGLPLVLHGSSGLSDDQFRRLIANGIAKVNYFTALTDHAAQHLRGNAHGHDNGYLGLFDGVRQVVEADAEHLMRVWGSAGRAAEVIAQCRPWRAAQHVIAFHLEGSDAAEVALIINRGSALLRGIPGVREVRVEEVLTTAAPPQFRWRLLLAAPELAPRVSGDGAFAEFAKRYLLGVRHDSYRELRL